MICKLTRLLLLTLLLTTLASLSSFPALAQPEPWQKVAPIAQTFTISMPTRAAESIRLIALSEKDLLNANVYSSVKSGKRFLAAGFFKTEPDRTIELSSFDRFVRGIEQSFKISANEITRSLVFDRDISHAGSSGKQYRVNLGDYAGVARLLEKDNGFYALMVIGADENDPDAQRFFSSFDPGEKNTNPESTGVIVDVPSNASQLEQVRAALPPEPWTRMGRPISGGILNGKAVSLARPEYPLAARANGDSGEAAVQIVIDELGHVAWAEGSEGPATLREAAVAAAWKSRFTSTRLRGQPIKVTGRLVYNFERGP